MNTELQAALIGAGAAILTLLLGETIQYYRRAFKELNDYIIALEFARNELVFYLGKLKQLVDELDAAEREITHRRKPIIPTYDVYPSFLEQAKITLARLYKNAQLVQQVGHCHYELSHIRQRLTL